MSLQKDSSGLLRGVNRRHARAAEMPHVIIKLNKIFEGRVLVEVSCHLLPPAGSGGRPGWRWEEGKDSAAFRSPTDPPSAWGFA
jgi:hypothetical protein